MQMTRKAALVLLLLGCIAGGVAGGLEDGFPRPLHFADAPTTSYGPYPELRDASMVVADCDWYGFGNVLFSNAQVRWCLEGMRAALTNATENPPSSLRPFMYYTLSRMIDPANNESYCYQGCFKLDALSGDPASSPGLAPPPYVRGSSLAPLSSPGSSPAMAPIVADSPSSSSEGSPALSPRPESGSP